MYRILRVFAMRICVCSHPSWQSISNCTMHCRKLFISFLPPPAIYFHCRDPLVVLAWAERPSEGGVQEQGGENKETEVRQKMKRSPQDKLAEFRCRLSTRRGNSPLSARVFPDGCALTFDVCVRSHQCFMHICAAHCALQRWVIV